MNSFLFACMDFFVLDVDNDIEVEIKRSIFIGWKHSPLFPS